MDINELTQFMHRFVRSKGWYKPDSNRPQTLRNLAISINLEAAEILEHFQWDEKIDESIELSEELADVALYLFQIASCAGVDLEDAILDKLAQNYSRKWDEPLNAAEPKMVKDHGPKITIFGGSLLNPSDPDYKQALRLGRLLAEKGYIVITGGYMGTMEALSKGASEAGAHVIGVTCDEVERWRPVGPNPWVQEERRYPTMRQRLYALVEGCDAALALPGGIGTLAEISVMWSQLQVGAISSRPLILIGSEWEEMMTTFSSLQGDYILEDDQDWLSFAPDIESAVDLLSLHIDPENA